VYDEALDLALLDVVESNNTDEATRIARAASLNFGQNFLRSSGAEQGQLPKSPVVDSWIGIFVEFDRRVETLLKGVLDLTSDLSIAQRGKIRKSFVTTLFW
jgi:hypothetical protein